jgi:hypothetical protein
MPPEIITYARSRDLECVNALVYASMMLSQRADGKRKTIRPAAMMPKDVFSDIKATSEGEYVFIYNGASRIQLAIIVSQHGCQEIYMTQGICEK